MQAKGRATAALQQAQQQLNDSMEHLALLKKQLAEERQSGAASSANLDCVQAELAQCKTQVRASSNFFVEVCSCMRHPYSVQNVSQQSCRFSHAKPDAREAVWCCMTGCSHMIGSYPCLRLFVHV